MGTLFNLKQELKAFLQNDLLPKRYDKYKNQPIEKGKVIFADAHSDGLTPSMKALYIKLRKRNMHILNMCVDFSRMKKKDIIRYINYFMKEYATAEYVILSSYFLPVSACDKRPETKVIQLWHSGGILKKMGYDAKDDIPEGYKGKPSKNFDFVTVSSEACIPVWASGLGMDEKNIHATGLSRTDLYYSEKFNKRNEALFYENYPLARGKKICVYAPSFSGNAAEPKCEGLESGILEVFEELSDEWFFIIKVHPLLEKKYPQYTTNMQTEELFSVADLLISDYSSVVFDFLVYRKPFILYAPDIDKYKEKRGFYLDYDSFPVYTCYDADTLKKGIQNNLYDVPKVNLEACFRYHMGNCDGHATDRIISEAGIKTIPVKMIALDLDGTLLNNKSELTAYSKAVIERAIAEGIEVVIASGRSYNTLPPEVTGIKGIRFAICSNGASIYNNETKERIKSYYMTRESIRQIVRIARRNDVIMDAFYDGTPYSEEGNIEEILKLPFLSDTQKEYIRKTRKIVPSIRSFIKQHFDEIDCLNFSIHDEKKRRKVLKEIYNEVDDIFLTQSMDHLIEMSYMECGKGNALRYLAEMLDIDRENIASFGNADNDADMIDFARFGFAVSDASDAAKKAALRVIGSNDDDGVAKVILKFLKG